MANVSLQNIARRFPTTTAVENITFQVPDGEFWVLVGPSGCGKSTILRMIAGLDFPTEGQIYIADQQVNQTPARDRDVAMVFQNYALYPHMTVAENLAFGLKMRNIDRSNIQQRIRAVTESLDLTHLLHRKPKQLSGGQQQRVALGRAIIRQPQVFLLDEPLSNLDAQLRDDTRAELKRLHQSVGTTTLYVTHDQTEAMTLADKIVVLSQGKIQQIATPQDIYTKPANRMVATFMGTPPMNLFPVTYQNQCFWLNQHPIPCPPHLQSQLEKYLNATRHPNLELGIRPEHLQLHSNPPAITQEGMVPITVDLIEPLGREDLIHAHLSSEPRRSLTIVTKTSALPHPQEQLCIQLESSQIKVFEASEGKLLCL